jgi:uncharacterized damage-inducible protein DinB|tara:strand:+ start:346 stop:570 length:225 start_codon:yes stop_codon:yes gene_type:complete
MNDKWNDNLEIGGDLQDEYKAIQEAEANEGAPEIELSDDDLEAWYQGWLSEQDDPASIDPDWYATWGQHHPRKV